MARFKDYSYEQGKLIPITYREQILPDTFEYALNHIIDNEIDLSVFESKYRNDETGAPAFDPAILLKIILFAYSKGITSSRKIAQCCTENVVFMALSADTQPHFTTIASFISSMEKQITSIFRDVLLICTSENLIGKNMFAVDGCKISSNCSKEWSGTRSGFKKKKEKLEKSIKFLIKKHMHLDLNSNDSLELEQMKKEKKAIEKLSAKARKIKKWLQENRDKKGKGPKPIQSNITDNESAKMTSSHGVIQGYNGIAAVDDKHQVVVHAQAEGSGNETDMLKPMTDGIRDNFKEINESEDVFEEAQLTADSGFHSEDNMKMLDKEEIDGYVADNKFRKRDPRFDNVDKHKNNSLRIDRNNRGKKYFTPSDFSFDKKSKRLFCPAGKEMKIKCPNFQSGPGGYTGVSYRGDRENCLNCDLRDKCIRNKDTAVRQVAILDKSIKGRKGQYTQKMIDKFDSLRGREIYSKRMGTVEPVFGNIRSALRLDRFTLRGKIKVNIQWNLFCIVHNIGKMFRYGYAIA